MARYLILGAGKFGRLAVERLARQDGKAAFMVVDRDAAALAAARAAAPSPRVEWVEAEAGDFLNRHLQGEPPWDWLIPMVPGHAAFAYLMAGPLADGAWETTPAPEDVGALTPVALRGAQGELYLSRAAHLCPDDCVAPESTCPVSGESRETPLSAALAALSVSGFRVLVLASQQLAPGVGGYSPRRLLALARELEALPGQAIIATACRCHGVVHALRRRPGGKA
jgi:hypothetical protein